MNPFGDLIPTKQNTSSNPFMDLTPTAKANTPTSFGSKIKSALGGFASGVGGIALTAEDWLGRKIVNAVGSDSAKKNLAAAPTLNSQFGTMFGAEQNPKSYGAGQLVGEIASLATPVNAVGTFAKAGSEALGAGKFASNIVKAGTEGLAFTAGMGLTENKKETLGDYAINAGLNMAFPIAGAGLKKVAETLPSRIINSLIKPLAKDFAYGKNPGESIAKLGIKANTFDDLIAKIRDAKNMIGSQIGQVIDRARNLPLTDLNNALDPIDNAISTANKTPLTNKSLIQRLENVKADLVQNMKDGTVQNGQELKGTVGNLTKWTGNVSDDAAVNKALKQVYGGIRDKMDTALQKVLTPEEFQQYKQLTEHYGNLISADNAATYRDKILERSNMISFGAKNAGLITGLGVALSTGGVGLPAFLAGLAGVVIDKTAATPAFKTRLAALLAKMAPDEIGTFFSKVPTAKTLFTEQEIKNLGKKTVSSSGKASIGTLVGGAALGTAATVANLPSKTNYVASQQTPVTVRGVQINPEDKNNLIKAIYSESSNRGKSVEPLAMLNVIINKANSSGKSISSIISDPNFIQGIKNKRYSTEPQGIDKETYQFISDTVDKALNGEFKDTTNGATHFVHITQGKNKNKIVVMNEKQFAKYFKKKGALNRDAYALSLLGL